MTVWATGACGSQEEGSQALRRCCEEACQVMELEAASRRAQLVRYSNMAFIMIYVSCNSE